MKFLSNRFLSVLMLGVGIGFCSPALAGDKGLSIEDITRLKRVTSVELSEDGNYIAYLVTDPSNPVKENNPAEIHLYVYNMNNKESKAYYTHGSVSDVAFRPESETVIFIARPEGEEVNAIYEMPLHGGASMKLYQFETSVSDYEWASGGDRLAFTATAPEDDDIVDGVDYLIDKGIADPERIGVIGGSYGGYATGWMATYYSDRFAAGVMNFGISNNISKWGTSDIPEELYLVHARERLWEDNNWQKYLERSPIYHVGNAQTPLLITHGKADTRVHPSQSLELFRHMKVRKPEVPLRLVRYPGAGHGYRRATAQYDYTLRMFRWFDTYLKGDGEFPDRSIDEELPE